MLLDMFFGVLYFHQTKLLPLHYATLKQSVCLEIQRDVLIKLKAREIY